MRLDPSGSARVDALMATHAPFEFDRGAVVLFKDLKG